MYTEPTIISRQGWGSRKPTYTPARIKTPTPRLWLHHTVLEGTGPAAVRDTQNFHMDTRRYNDIAYSFLTDDMGVIFEGRGAGIQGGHTLFDNTQSSAICAIGNYEARKPSRAHVNAIVNLAIYGHAQGWWPKFVTGGHRDAPFANTACPGRYLHALITDINALIATRGTLTTDVPLEVDVPAPHHVTGKLDTLVGNGSWLLQYDGGILTRGDAPFFGSYPGLPEADRQGERGFYIIERHGLGYRLVGTDGAEYIFPT